MAERNDNGMGSGIMLGLFIGAAIGGVLGLLFAPQSGEATRSLLRERSMNMRDRARSLGETGQEMLRDAISEGRDAATRARSEMDEWVQRTRPATDTERTS